MEVNLYKMQNRQWAVKAKDEIVMYPSIEEAADAMLSLGVKDEEIDLALSDLASQGHYRAHFGITGRFILSDEEKPNVLGTA